jgi:hypothetical protein
MNLDFESAGVEQLHHTIRTDNGGKLAGSDDFQTKVGEHSYILETTAPDTSSQNGLAERPHRTLKENVRCLLYTAGLGVTFWSTAILHAVSLSNRTFHTELDSTPYQMYTGRRPTVDGLFTFGCRLTPKKSTAAFSWDITPRWITSIGTPTRKESKRQNTTNMTECNTDQHLKNVAQHPNISLEG